MTMLFSRQERDYLKQLILECQVQRFTEQESLAYIKAKMGKAIGIDYLQKVKLAVKRNLAGRLNYYRKSRTAYIEQYFRRIAEIEKYQQALWNEYHMHPEKPYLRKDCILALHELTITLANLYEILPAFTTPGIDRDREIATTNIPEYNPQTQGDTQQADSDKAASDNYTT